MQFLFKKLLSLCCTLGLTAIVIAQTVSITSNYPSSLVKPVNAGFTISTSLSRSSNGWTGSGNYTWSVSPTTGVTLNDGTNSGTTISSSNGSGSPITITFTDVAVAGTYTITVTRGSSTATTTITLIDNNNSINLWVAKSTDASTSRVEVFSVNGSTVNAGPATLFYTGGTFAAMGRSPYPTPSEGYFYWIPYSAGTNGVLNVMGVNGDGSNPTQVISSFDDNGASNANITFVRFALGVDGIGWVLASSGSDLILTKIPFNTSPGNGLNTVTPIIEDDNITLIGGSTSTFANGDLCLDGSGNIYLLANNNGLTEIYIGTANGSSSEFTKRWEIKDPNGDNFTGSVNGCAFNSTGAMYITTSSGLYYLDPASIAVPSTGYKTINAMLVSSQTNYTDLGTNVFPSTTSLPVVFTDINGKILNNQLLVNWSTSTEKNNVGFEIEISKDGKNFIKAGQVNSKAISGNSNTAINYNFSININSTGTLLGISLFSLAFFMLLINRKNKLVLLLLLFSATSIFTYSCTKSTAEQIDVNNDNKLFVRIKQIDKDNHFQYSRTITVYKAD